MSEKDGPVFLLSLDGGGVRGICELVMLDTIMKRIQKERNLAEIPRPCALFDLIGGISTGGLVSIMLGRLRMTTTEAIAAYHEFAEKIFSWKNKNWFFLVPLARVRMGGNKMSPGKFKTKKLERIIQELVKNAKSEERLLTDKDRCRAKMFVCTQRHNDTGASSLVVLRSYKVPSRPLPQEFVQQIHGLSSSTDSTSSLLDGTHHGTPDDLQPVEDHTSVKIWEAARATSAASSFFPPMEVKDSHGRSTLFIDAALGCNNPVKHVIAEAAGLFGVERKLGCVLSLGTGLVGDGLISTGSGTLVNIVKAIKDQSTSSETTNKEVANLFGGETNSFFRLNVPMGKKIKLDDWKAVGPLAADTAKYMESKEAVQIVDQVVEILLGEHRPKVKLGQVAPVDKGQFRPKKPPTGRPSTTAHYIGRQDVISKLAETLVPQKATRTSALIWAEGGAGKTTTASRFLDEYDSEFDKIFWVDASNEETIIASYALIAEVENIAVTDSNVTGVVLSYIASFDGHWILVLDNAQSDVSKYVPPGQHGCLLFTSRNSSIKPRVAPDNIIKLEDLQEEDAITLLFNIAQIVLPSRKDKEDAVRIVRDHLAYLPLAIEQAAAHIQKQEISLAVYASRFEEQRRSLLSRRSPGSEGSKSSTSRPPPGTEAVHVSFDLTYEVLVDTAHGNTLEAHDAKNALRVLSVFSFYANEGLMGDIFKRAAENRPADRTPDQLGGQTLLSLEPVLVVNKETQQWDMSAFQAGILCLMQWSLVRTNDRKDRFSMHLLTHDWARERSTDRERLARAETARHILFDSYAWMNKGTRDWLFNRKLMPHMRACFDNTNAYADQNPVVDASHKDRYAEMLMHEDRPHEAIRLLELPLATFAKDDRILTEEYWHMLRTVAESALSVGMLDQAEKLAKQIERLQDIMIGLGKFKPSSVTVLNTQVLLADILAQKQGHWPEAEARLNEIIATGVAENGEGHWLGYWLSTLQTKYTLHNQHEDAYQIARKTHELCHRIYEAGHKNALDSTRNLARACVQSGRLEDAEDLVLEVLKVEEAHADGGTQIQTLNKTRVLLADVLLRQERYEEAYNRFDEVVQVLRLEPSTSAHEDLPGAYQGLGEAALFLGYWEEGLDFGRIAFMFLHSHLGAKNKKTRQACATVILWLSQAEAVGFTVSGALWDEFWQAANDVEHWEPATKAMTTEQHEVQC
ncbi:uncharacterized protein B0I36DRAFT_317159 [Microdochium trichocladiopsis]|uniref:PNPLA domain-containing protein n=1 Tax=Microdochium trichocladiopsis TaxID=1682393 RepID=A0A9P8YDD3_9PEZI|nr:uncharacterized protein B0I36DRAFT_317159 [Microdochium trichocladiopsis]KAH7034886.1 hypothetical protein B0I36DRAFT_317159 [Microdochium trichocladiopsis]